MYTYTYTRNIVSDRYDLDNPNYVVDGSQVTLYSAVLTAFPTNNSRIDMHGADCDISFETELTAGEQTTLDTTVSTYRAYTP